MPRCVDLRRPPEFIDNSLCTSYLHKSALVITLGIEVIYSARILYSQRSCQFPSYCENHYISSPDPILFWSKPEAMALSFCTA